jgi:hypothetical protein
MDQLSVHASVEQLVTDEAEDQAAKEAPLA